ncbi:hypothetical protein CLV24_114143 [Pontibacter ummariensis]|uniref:Uncharacterized protein n=1 Tax=Pontibacter ummariensis TaxID=1610492 RepID=A0A239HSG5_9BACT|nr:hypothetical protein CLV24_114143 [Pontibacter ummariensis]SNS84230.1 hypothetical protein SAMN06296052_114143 [Pontibacter ummariensis]
MYYKLKEKPLQRSLQGLLFYKISLMLNSTSTKKATKMVAFPICNLS